MIKIDNEIASMQTLTPADKLLFGLIKGMPHATVEVNDLAESIGVTGATINASARRLEAQGLIRVTRYRRGVANKYEVIV